MHGMDRKEYRDHGGTSYGKGDHGGDSSHLYGNDPVAFEREGSEDSSISAGTGGRLCGSDDPAKAYCGETSL